MIEWFAKNSVAANLLMFGIVLSGLVSASKWVAVETFPNIQRDEITISTPFRAATPGTIEQSITLRVEEAISDLEGIKEINSRSTESLSTVVAEIDPQYNVRNLLDDIKVRVDAINTLPVEAERPTVSINTRNPVVIFVAVHGNTDEKTLRETAERFREGLLRKRDITNVELEGVANYQMNVQISPETLDDYNMSLADIGRAIRSGAADISAGTIQTVNGDILLRSDSQAYTASEFAKIPIKSGPNGKPVVLGDIATIDDGFEEKLLNTTYNGNPSVLVEVRRVGQQSAIQVSAQTKEYMQTFSSVLPNGVKLDYWDDDSLYLKTRIGAVVSSAIWGGILVIILLSLFLRPGVALWVFIGIPVSFMGAFLFMPQAGISFNVISLFAFILVLGIVVDDAIVTGENIYRKLREGDDPLEAAIEGTKEIATPVTFGILTTVAAFIPLSFLGGNQPCVYW